MNMGDNLLVSVVIATYNAEKHIRVLLESLRNYKTSLCEVLIIDGLSDDDTLKIIGTFTDVVDKVVSEKDNGIYDAMEKGISLASGKFVCFFGADDELLMNFNELENILINEDTVYYGNVLLSDSNRVYDGEFSLSKLISKNICHQSIFYPRHIIQKYGFRKKYRLLADYVLNLELWADKEVSFKYFNSIVARYSTSGLSSTTLDREFKKNSLWLIFKLFGIRGVMLKLNNLLMKSISRDYEK